jgi:hypothetical protein
MGVGAGIAVLVFGETTMFECWRWRIMRMVLSVSAKGGGLAENIFRAAEVGFMIEIQGNSPAQSSKVKRAGKALICLAPGVLELNGP